ncbi:MAG: hypothetical protein LBP91_01740 [Coriobacteriales bacterium]|jgi:hypothetical protein|nr:hypothetical protein [Coriobacteriales bacterium]
MKLYISHQSALEFWRKPKAKEALGNKRVQIERLSAKPADAKGLSAHESLGLALPLHVLVGSDNARKVSRSLVSHISTREYPCGSFFQAADWLFMSSPELCFVQMASELSLIELIVLGYELCGGYRLDCAEDSEQGFCSARPLTNAARLGSYIAKAVSHKGRTNAGKALRHIADNSASPMETALALLLGLPCKLGGYGLPAPLLNYHVKLPDTIKKSLGKNKLFGDLFWPDAKLDVEYDSDSCHTGSEQIKKDAVRRNALISLGITVITVSRMQINSTAELRTTAEQLSKQLGVRLRDPKEFSARHALLRQQLLPRVSLNR